MKKLQLLLFAVLAYASVQGQKLPDVQQTSLRAPANIKIDGKPTEWNKFEAYNRATDLYYTMSNDDKNLYLVIQASNANVLSKITNRGILLVIDPSAKRNEKGAVSVNYPVFELQYNNKPFIQFSNTGGLTSEQRRTLEANPDSMLTVANKRLHASDKFIRTNGIANVDTLLSIYNDKDIVAGEAFEKGPVYTYELAMPFKYLQLQGGPSAKFSYHIVLDGLNIERDLGMRTTITPDGRMAVEFTKGAVLFKREDLPAVNSATDFWGEYTLAK